MTQFAQHKVIAWCKLTFDEMVVIHRVGAQEREEVQRLREGLALFTLWSTRAVFPMYLRVLRD